MPTFVTSIKYITESASQSNYKKIKENAQIIKGRNKIVSVCK
jgi:hypothetical protein